MKKLWVFITIMPNHKSKHMYKKLIFCKDIIWLGLYDYSLYQEFHKLELQFKVKYNSLQPFISKTGFKSGLS